MIGTELNWTIGLKLPPLLSTVAFGLMICGLEAVVLKPCWMPAFCTRRNGWMTPLPVELLNLLSLRTANRAPLTVPAAVDEPVRSSTLMAGTQRSSSCSGHGRKRAGWPSCLRLFRVDREASPRSRRIESSHIVTSGGTRQRVGGKRGRPLLALAP